MAPPTGGSANTIQTCPSCGEKQQSSSDKFCRGCGTRLATDCSKCGKPARITDKFCGNCGAKRWQIVEMWKSGAYKDTVAFKIGVVVISVAAVGGLYFAVRKKL